MKSNYKITRISRGAGPSVHRYYDVPLESPDSTKLVYFEFNTNEIPGKGKVIVCDADGSNHQVIADGCEGIGHSGCSQMWIDNTTIAFCPELVPEKSVIKNLLDNEQVELIGNLRSYFADTGLGIVNDCRSMTDDDSYKYWQTAYLWNRNSGETREMCNVFEMAKLHELYGQFDPAVTCIKNPKWSPDGSKLMVVFADENYYQYGTDRKKSPDAPKVKSLYIMDSDGSNLKYIGLFSHHPMWSADGKSLICHEVNSDGASQKLVAYPIDGGEKYTLLENFQGIHSMMNKTGTHIVTDPFINETEAAILLYSLETGEVRELARGTHVSRTHITGTHLHPRFSDDETKIFFNMADTGVSQLYAVDINGLL